MTNGQCVAFAVGVARAVGTEQITVLVAPEGERILHAWASDPDDDGIMVDGDGSFPED